MNDPNVRHLGDVEGYDGEKIAVGVDYDTVAIYMGAWLSADGIRLTGEKAEEFGRLFVAAGWQAGHNAAPMAGETP
jgi:hypothetical protein